jgi:hypothetical protein
MLWEKKKDHKNDDQLKSEIGSSNVIREEEGSKERCSIEKRNMKCDCYERRRRIKKR